MRNLYFLLLISPLVFSCNKSESVSQTTPAVNSLPVNTKFNINLPENHTNGYLWQLNNTYDINSVDYMNSVWHGNEKGVIFNFESREKGKTELEFHLIKYKDTLESKTFIIEVK